MVRTRAVSLTLVALPCRTTSLRGIYIAWKNPFGRYGITSPLSGLILH